MTGTPIVTAPPIGSKAAAVSSLSRSPAGRTARMHAERELFARRDTGDTHARDELVERFLPLARSLARRYERSGEPMEDLVQVASLALVKAIARFDPVQGTAFTSFAVPTIVGELKRHFRDRGWSVRPPRPVQELSLRVARATGELTQDLDRSPTVGELAVALESDEEQILEALQALRGRDAVSLQAPAGDDAGPLEVQDTLGSLDDQFAHAESRVLIDSLGAGLHPRSREVLRLRFEQDLTQREIGERLGVSQMHVSRLIREALTHMRDAA